MQEQMPHIYYVLIGQQCLAMLFLMISLKLDIDEISRMSTFYSVDLERSYQINEKNVLCSTGAFSSAKIH